MASFINVDGSDDPSYRYKMPRLISKVEGRGNGVKTVIVNCSDIAQALNRSTAQVNKYFGCELGAMTNYEEKVDKALVNGSFDNKILQETLTGYIQKFVLCPSCGNPETVQELKGKKRNAILFLSCKACGAVEEADNSHKLLAFIVKEMTQDGSSGLSKKELRKQKRNEKNRKKDEKSSEDTSSEVKSKDKKKKKKKKDGESEKKKKKKKKKHREEKLADMSDSDKDGLDDLTNELGSLTVHDLTALNTSVDRVTELLANGETAEALEKAVIDQQTNTGLRRADRIAILFYAFLNQKVALTNVLKGFSALGKTVAAVKDCFLSQGDIEIELLLCLEEAYSRLENDEEREKLKKTLPVLLKLLFDEDLVEESTIIAWSKGELDEKKYNHVRCVVADSDLKTVKAECAPVVNWLQEAETDSESEED